MQSFFIGFSDIYGFARRLFKKAVVWAFLVTVVRGVGFFVVMAYALRKLPSSEIGLWYVMLNIAGLACIVELGFSSTIGRFSSFYMAGSEYVPRLGLKPFQVNGTVRPNYRALAGLIIMARSLYMRFGIFVMFIMLLCGGLWLSSKSSQLSVDRVHIIAFFILTIGSGLNMMGLFWHGLQFGINRVLAYNQFFIISLLLSYIVSFCGLYSELGLMALVFGFLILNFTCRFLARRDVLAFIPNETFDAPETVSWRNLWPMTWRSGVASWASFLCIQNTALICSLIADLNTTASYGFSLQLGLLLHGFSTNWLSVKYPLISHLRVQGAVKKVICIVWKRMLLSFLTFIAGAVAIIYLAPLVLTYVNSKTQVLPVSQMISLFFIVGIDQIIGMHAAIMQTGNQVPHLIPFIFSGILVTLFGLLLGNIYGINGLIAAVMLSQIIYNYWWTPLRCWKDLFSSTTKKTISQIQYK